MVEDTGKIISNGFETYTKNLNLCVPFVVNLFVSRIMDFLFFSVGFSYILGSNLSSLNETASPEQIISTILPLISRHIFEIAIMVILFILISLFFQAFFTAGAIGMAKQATETGTLNLSSMLEYGKKNVVNLYLAEILIGLLLFAGVVFLVPGALSADRGNILSSDTSSILLFMIGVLVWIIYAVILSIVLALASYALVVESLGPVDGIIAGYNFFTKQKFDVFLLWLIILIVSAVPIIGLVILGAIFGMNFIWLLIILVSVLIIAPLTTLWWVRLYMTRTDKKIYFNELLAHPNELEKF
ncbi:MAG: hypothetical protein ABOK23_01190 [Candidatus Methanoperedens sp.]|nr:hypothetical protein [Candidatus Methanoperedens sp.]MCZ7394645.1 hypothetical protein [Candidatus Methanoperedens sp.]